MAYQFNPFTGKLDLVGSSGGGGSGTVTSVALTSPGILYTVSGSPVTTSGTLTLNLISQTANTFLAAPNGSSGNPSFRSLVIADLPVGTGTVTSVGLTSPGVLYTISGSPVTGSGTLALNLISQAQSATLMGPVSGSGVPSFRAILSSDIANITGGTP